MRFGRVISFGLVAVLGLIATARLSCTLNVGIPEVNPAPVVAPEAPGGPAGGPFLGLPPDFKAKATEAYKAFPAPFRVNGAGVDRKKQAFLWKAVQAIESPGKPLGEHYPAFFQQTGDCVSFGGGCAIYYTAAVQVANGNAAAAVIPFQSHLYGISRVNIGGGRPRCGSAGAYPDDLAEGFRTLGYVSYEEAGVEYSGRLADTWGCKGPPKALVAVGKARAGGDVYPARTTDEAIEALINGYALTAGIDWRPGRTRSADGSTVTLFDGRNQGGHQIALVGYDGLAGDGQFIFHNSHGADAHPRNGSDPPGSFRVTRSTLDWMMDTGTFWVFSSVPGFPKNELDLSGLDDLVLRAAEPPSIARKEASDVRSVLLAP